MTRRKRTGMILVLGVAVLLVVAGGAFAAFGFTDVAANNVHGAAIQWASDHGIILGYSDGTFKPTNSIQRDQATSMFMRYDTYLRASLPTGGGSVAGCTECHNDTTLITGKKTAWMESLHGTGTAYARGTEASCAGCHSGGAFSAMIAAGQDPSEVTTGDMDPTRQDCRACHQIHTTNTGADFALETTAPVALAYVPGSTFDGGDGNLCANCHQPRRVFPEPNAEGMITGISSHWGPHHGPQSATMLGVAGAGVADGSPMFHYTGIENTCVTCHMSGPQDHKFLPAVSTCAAVCHVGATSFDIGGTQTEVQTRLDAIGTELVSLGLLSDITVDGHPTVTSAPEAQAIALYNWIYIAHEDKSLGVHNPAYTRAMLVAAEEALDLPVGPAN